MLIIYCKLTIITQMLRKFYKILIHVLLSKRRRYTNIKALKIRNNTNNLRARNKMKNLCITLIALVIVHVLAFTLCCIDSYKYTMSYFSKFIETILVYLYESRYQHGTFCCKSLCYRLKYN